MTTRISGRMTRRRVRTRIGRYHRRFARLVRSRSRRTAKRAGQTPGATGDGRKLRLSGPGRSRQRQNFSRHDYLQFRAPLVFCPAGHTPHGTRGKSRAPVSHANAGTTRQPISRRCPWKNMSHFSSRKTSRSSDLLKRLPIPNRPGALVPPRLPPYFRYCGSGASRPHDRGMRATGRKIADNEFSKSGCHFSPLLRPRVTFRKMYSWQR